MEKVLVGVELNINYYVQYGSIRKYCMQCLSQDLETGCLKLALVKSLGVQFFKGDQYSYFNHKHV